MGKWSIRPLNASGDNELDRLLNLYHACLTPGDKQLSSEDLRDRLNWPGHDPARDRWVAEDGAVSGSLVGTGWVWSQSSERCIVSASVHPQWRRQGLGTELIETAVRRAVEKGASHVTTTVKGQDAGARSFLSACGFEVAGNVWVLEAPAGGAVPEPVWPQGYSGRTFAEVNDLGLLVKVMNRCYHDMWGHTENTPGAVDETHVQEWMARNPQSFIPEGMVLAFGPDGSAVGFSRAELSDGDLVVDGPGVAPEHRGVDLRSPLVLAVMRFLRSRGEGPILLQSWGDSRETVEIYRQIGFNLREHYLEYKRDFGE